MQQHRDAGVRGSILLHLWQAGMGRQAWDLRWSCKNMACPLADMDLYVLLIFFCSLLSSAALI
jgi:hypothetical protein